MAISPPNNHTFNTLFSGHFNPDEVRIKWHSQKRTLPPALFGKMDSLWDHEIIAKNKHHFIFNGELCRLDSWQIQDNFLILSLGLTSYKELLYSNRFAAEIVHEFGEPFLSKALGISVILISGDKQIMLIKRSSSVGEFPNRIDVIGGHIHPQEHATAGIPDPFFAIKDEIQEELNFSVMDSKELKCLGAIETTVTKKPELLFSFKTDWQVKDIVRVASKKKCLEIAELFSIHHDRDALEDFLKTSENKLSPSAYGVLSLYTDLLKVSADKPRKSK